MSNLISQLTLLSPEIFVALMAMLILLLDLFIQDKNKHLIYGLSQLTLLVALAFRNRQSVIFYFLLPNDFVNEARE